MLDLDDPLWRKLDTPHGLDFPDAFRALSREWDEDTAQQVLWQGLLEPDQCYGVTYAAIPHLLRLAQVDDNVAQRSEIALWLGAATLWALEPREVDGVLPYGLPATSVAWAAKLAPHRQLYQLLTEATRPLSDYERTEMLSRSQSALEIGPVTDSELPKIEQIRADFFGSIAAIRKLIERAYLEQLEITDRAGLYLGGVAATDGLFGLARRYTTGEDGGYVACASCGWEHEHAFFGSQMALYASRYPPGIPYSTSGDDDPGFLDWQDGAPSRADAVVTPYAAPREHADPRVRAIAELAAQSPSPRASAMLRNFLGTFTCAGCGAKSRVAPVEQ